MPQGSLSLVQTLSTLPPGHRQAVGRRPARHADGRFLYNVGAQQQHAGDLRDRPVEQPLKLVAHTPTETQPRGFNIDPSADSCWRWGRRRMPSRSIRSTRRAVP